MYTIEELFCDGAPRVLFPQEEANELDSEKASAAAGLSDQERTSEYFLVSQQLERTREEVCRVIQRPENCLPYIKVTPAVVRWCVATTAFSVADKILMLR